MRTLEVQVTIDSTGQLRIEGPVQLPSGQYNAVLVLDEQPVQSAVLKPHLKRAQDLFRQYVPPSRSLSDELIQERRSEAADE